MSAELSHYANPDEDEPIPPTGHGSRPGDTIPLTAERVRTALARGNMREKGLLPYSSNYNFLVLVDDGDLCLPAVYKPRRGETPLWDFPVGTLHLREVAACLISDALGWHMVPPTVLRQGTRGAGSVQFYVDNDPEEHYFTVREDARFALTFRRIALFDYIVNNADRKSGHCLLGSDGRIWAIDHGICFHSEYKLRTVIWEHSGEPLAAAVQADLEGLQRSLSEPNDCLTQQLDRFLSRAESRALRVRLQRLLSAGVYPSPLFRMRNFPWPPI